MKPEPISFFCLRFIPLFLFITGLCAGPASAQQVPQEYRKYFVKYIDKRSYLEIILNSIGLTNEELGRSFALIAGVSDYPNMPRSDRRLQPAAEDLNKLEDYLKNVEFFDEIVILKNKDMNLNNLVFFLQNYFPQRLKEFPKSRFIFTYSGHGINDGSRGYLLLSAARSLSDKQSSINLAVIRVLFNEVVDTGHHILALINACFSGTFITRSFGSVHFLPKHRGAHAITAGGASEITWHDAKIGTGSIFFEKFFEGLNGYADGYPLGGDGVVTVDELAAYLKQSVQISTDQNQNPQAGDLMKGGSPGGFFFLNRHRQLEKGLLPPWPPEKATAYGPVDQPNGKIAQLLRQADAYFKRQWYTTPENTNAFDAYREVLQLDPSNERAHQQIDKIAAFYISMAEREERRRRKEHAIRYYRKYLEIVPDVAEVLDKISTLQSPIGTVNTRKPKPPAKKTAPDTLTANLQLRKKSLTVSDVEAKKVFKLDHGKRPLKYVSNKFKDNGDGTVADYATGLMWQQSGSNNYLEHYDAGVYIQALNQQRYAGFNDWRLPTIEELLSLLKKEKQKNGLYIAPVFDAEQRWCWSSDKRSYDSVWVVYFSYGLVDSINRRDRNHGYVRAVRP